MTLRMIRHEREQTITEMAEIVGVHFTTWARWEREGVPLNKVLLIERKTGIAREKLRPDLYAKAAA